MIRSRASHALDMAPGTDDLQGRFPWQLIPTRRTWATGKSVPSRIGVAAWMPGRWRSSSRTGPTIRSSLRPCNSGHVATRSHSTTTHPAIVSEFDRDSRLDDEVLKFIDSYFDPSLQIPRAKYSGEFEGLLGFRDSESQGFGRHITFSRIGRALRRRSGSA